MTQLQASVKLGITQAYLSLLERGLRPLPQTLVEKAIKVFAAPLDKMTLPSFEWTPPIMSSQQCAEQLALLGYPGFAYMRTRQAGKHPGEVLLTALAQPELEARVVEALPWLLLRYPDMDRRWLVRQARMNNLQNRLGYLVELAREMAHDSGAKRQLLEMQCELRDSLRQDEDTLCQSSMSEKMKQWMRMHRPAAAAEWNLLADLRPEHVDYAG